MNYRDFSISVEKQKEGYSMASYRRIDGWILIDEWNPCVKSKQEAINECIITIDDYYKNPDDYED